MLALALLLGASAEPLPAGVRLPLVIFDVDFNRETVGKAPQGPDKAALERLSADPWTAVPLRTYSRLDFITRDRTALVQAEALGLGDRPVVFTCPDGRQPHWGPRMLFRIPPAIARVGRRYRVSVDVSMEHPTQMGGITLEGITAVEFFDDGTVRADGAALARCRPSTPLHVEFLVAAADRTVTVRIDDGKPLTLPWQRPETARFAALRLDGLLPGGHARPGTIAFDNIRIVLEE